HPRPVAHGDQPTWAGAGCMKLPHPRRHGSGETTVVQSFRRMQINDARCRGDEVKHDVIAKLPPHGCHKWTRQPEQEECARLRAPWGYFWADGLFCGRLRM